MEPEGAREEILAEIERLRIKHDESTDSDIRVALADRIAQLEAALPSEAPAEEVQEEDPKAAEKLIREARVEKMRGQSAAALELLRRAEKAAPNSPAVLEALGDHLAERSQLSQAREAYAKAVALDPKNVGLERKYAELVLRTASPGPIEEQLRAGLSDWAIQGDDVRASGRAVQLLNLFAPGSGHVVAGRTGAGLGLLAAWALTVVLLVVFRTDLSETIGFAAGGRGRPSALGFLPILLAFVVYVIAAATSPKPASERGNSRRVERPRPPVDLPFE